MNAIAINAFSGTINNQQTTLVNGEELHAYLGISTRYSDWIVRRIKEFEFVRDLDFTDMRKFEQIDGGSFFGPKTIEKIEYHLTLDMAKELCMVERSDIGRQARRYFIEMEKQAREVLPTWALVSMSQEQAQRDAAVALALQGNVFLQKCVRYSRGGLSQSEIAKLLGCGKSKVERMQRLLRQAGVLDGAPVLVNGVKSFGLPRGESVRNDAAQSSLIG